MVLGLTICITSSILFFAVDFDMTLLSPEIAYLLGASFCATIGAIFDVQTRRIPNLLTTSILVCGLLLHLASGGWESMGMAAVAGLAGGAIFFVFFVVGGMGAGDIKLMAGVACIAGFGHLIEIFVFTALTGGLIAAALAILHGRLKSMLVNVGALIGHHATFGLQPHPELHLRNPRTLTMPYALAIAFGCWITVLGQTALR